MTWLRYPRQLSPLDTAEARHRGLRHRLGGRITPRVRGALERARVRCDRVRITPARTGSTLRPVRRRRSTRDHPPRVLGARGQRWGDPPVGRITPARTGSTKTPGISFSGRTDHHPRAYREHSANTLFVDDVDGSPRAYGEHLSARHTSPHAFGSPPRVRGARAQGPRAWPGRRITPARTRSTPSATAVSRSATDHPRRVRGARHVDGVGDLAVRITPARTGSTPRSPRPNHRTTDHPRANGEHGLIDDDGFAARRIAPARTGSTSIRPSRPPRRSDHPRVREARHAGGRCSVTPTDHPRAYGEHVIGSTMSAWRYGSPPRVRGAQLGHQRRPQHERITPARTGSTAASGIGCARSTDHPPPPRTGCTSTDR